MTTPYARTEMDDVLADLRRRIRTLEGIKPPPGPSPPPLEQDYGYTYFTWTPAITVFGGGAAPTIGQAIGIGVATATPGTSGEVLVHCYVQYTSPVGGSAGDWIFDFHPDYPRTRLITSTAAQNNFGYGYAADASAGLRKRVWPVAQSSFVNNRYLIQGDFGAPNVSSTYPFTWASGDVLSITMDYYSVGP